MRVIHRAALAGAATGLRTSVALAALAPPRARRLARTAVAGELVVDKLPWTPSRLSRSALTGRLVCAGAAGAVIARRAGERVVPAALVAAGAALASAKAGHDVRAAVSRERSPVLVAAAEDVVALGLAGLAQQR